MTFKEILNMVRVWSGVPTGLRIWNVKRKKHTNEKMRVVFVCQLSHLWGCLQSIYEEALKESEVEPYVLAVPEYWEDEVDTGAVDFLKSLGYEVLEAYNQETKTFFDLKSLNPDYVFLPRPYDHYLPKQYQSDVVSKYSKICYLCYGYTSEGDYMMQTCFSKYFTTNCYMIFPENESTRKFSQMQHPISSRIGIKKIIQTPFPRFDLVDRFRDSSDEHWIKARDEVNKRVIWTPRWTLEEKLGGSNFFAFKDFFFSFAKKHKEDEFLFRPHPLAFDNFLKTGLMTAEEIEEYKKTCANMENVQLDNRKEYLDSFATADILVSDMSGVVVDFAVTGKPIIYCSPNQVFNKASEKLLEGYYIVHDVKELEDTLEMLLRGEDPKRERRIRIVEEILGVCDGKNGRRILDYLMEDYRK